MAKTFKALSTKVPAGLHSLAFTVADLRRTTVSKIVREAVEDVVREEFGEATLRRAIDSERPRHS